MLSLLLRTIATRRLLAEADRVVVAVSGGPDSMALLHALWEARERLRIALEVAGVDHGLRSGAAAELDVVEARAAALELPFHRLAVGAQVASLRAGGAGVQEAARQARLAALAELAEGRGARKVALGHTADDQAETVLFRIVRGTGLRGLGGIPYARGPFVRPLLDVSRAEVLLYLRRRSIPFVQDPSNADLRFARARIRHRILPALAAENPRVVEALVRLASHARASEDDVPTARRPSARDTSPSATVGAPEPTAAPPVLIHGPGNYRWSDGAVLEVRFTVEPSDALFDADRLTWPLRVRGRLEGDRMRPRGGRGSRKLSDLMIDAKIQREARSALPVLTSAEDEILYVPGLRPSEIARPTATTRRALTVDYLSVVGPDLPFPSV